MKTLDRAEARELWNQYWHSMHQEWFKIEVLQDYTGEDDSPSLRAWLAGDKQKSLALLEQATYSDWREMCQEKHNTGVLMRRIRIIEKPYTPYTLWEMEFYKHVNIPGGEQILIVDKQDIANLDLPTGDLMMFDNKRVSVCSYDKTGRVIRQTFYDENDDIAKFLSLKHDLLPLAQPLQARQL
jgi:hypothetical protein